MFITVARLVCSFVVVVTAASLATPAHAQGGYVQQRPAEGTHSWGQDGWCYVVQGGQWMRMNYFRSFPDRNNAQVFDLFQNGQFLKRVDVSQPGWVKELTAANMAPGSPSSWYMYPTHNASEANIFLLVKASNSWWSVAQLRAAAAQQQTSVYNTGNPAAILGGPGSSLPSVGNPASILGGSTRSDAEVIAAARAGSGGRSPFLDPNCNASYNGCR